ncbi:MAG: protein translocase subunit SecD [Patescibacteria group bacterium]
MAKKRSIILLIIIIFFATTAALFVYPKIDFLSKYSPWRLGLDLVGGAQLVYEIDLNGVDKDNWSSITDGLRDVMERRVNLFGVSEPNVVLSKVGDKYRIIAELAGIKETAEAIKQIGRTAQLDFREAVQDNSTAATGTESQIQFASTSLTGRYLTKAQAITDQFGKPQISLSFNDEGAKLFEEITGRNIGKPLAISIDNEIISSPRVNEKIIGGNAVITGMTIDEARSLTNLLNAGALPAPVNLIGQNLIGASLGMESLKKAVFAGIIGSLIVMVFMVFYYRLFGIFASLALLIYIVLTLAIFKGMSITMNLSGIAGFILSIGMAIDANILIFERTKEEIKNGLSKIMAIEEGFKRAWPSIRDSNITTIITSIILYYSTTSFVRGFALTLLIGVLISMFSAIIITRTMLRVFIKK